MHTKTGMTNQSPALSVLVAKLGVGPPGDAWNAPKGHLHQHLAKLPAMRVPSTQRQQSMPALNVPIGEWCSLPNTGA